MRLEGLEPSIIDPKKLKPFVASSTFRIIFYHKISYQKSLNLFIYRHFNHFILSNNIIQYKHEKIQHKTAHLQKSCIILTKICSSYEFSNFLPMFISLLKLSFSLLCFQSFSFLFSNFFSNPNVLKHFSTSLQ